MKLLNYLLINTACIVLSITAYASEEKQSQCPQPPSQQIQTRKRFSLQRTSAAKDLTQKQQEPDTDTTSDSDQEGSYSDTSSNSTLQSTNSSAKLQSSIYAASAKSLSTEQTATYKQLDNPDEPDSESEAY